MRSNQPPRTGEWLLRHLGCSPNNDVVIGDLNERYERGRSRLWYWEQVARAVFVSFFMEAWKHKLPTMGAVSLAWLVRTVSFRGFNLTWQLLFALTSWSSLFRHHWIKTILLFPQPVLWAAISGWLVARLHRQNRKPMVLANAAYFLCLSAVHVYGILNALLAVHFLNDTVEGLISEISIVTLMPLAVLLGGGVLGTGMNSKSSERAAAS